jgi:hypothetical protein
MIIPSWPLGGQSRLSHGKRRLSTVQFRESGRMDTIASMRAFVATANRRLYATRLAAWPP